MNASEKSDIHSLLHNLRKKYAVYEAESLKNRMFVTQIVKQGVYFRLFLRAHRVF